MNVDLNERQAEVVVRVLRAVAPVLDAEDRDLLADVCAGIIVEGALA